LASAVITICSSTGAMFGLSREGLGTGSSMMLRIVS
jgi:hypothetical protein